MKNAFVLLVPQSFLTTHGIAPGDIPQNQAIQALERQIRAEWRDDDLASFRFVAVPLNDGWQSVSDAYLAEFLVTRNLDSDASDLFVAGHGFEVGSVPVLFERWLFIVIRHPVPDDLEWSTDRQHLEARWDGRTARRRVLAQRRKAAEEEKARLQKAAEEENARLEGERKAQRREMKLCELCGKPIGFFASLFKRTLCSSCKNIQELKKINQELDEIRKREQRRR